jgi:type III secretory pathway component EscT
MFRCLLSRACRPASCPVVEQMTRLSANVLLVGLQLSAPILLALFLVDVAFASLGKVIPQVTGSLRKPDREIIGWD